MYTKFRFLFIFITNIIIMSYVDAAYQQIHCDLPANYKKAQNKLLHKNYEGAIQDLIKLKNLHPFHPYPQQIHIDLIYAYYKINNLKLASSFAQHFLQLYPDYKNLDYILYMNGLINMSLDKRNTFFLIKYLNINWCNYNSNYANNAFHSFLQLIKNYPNSQYCFDAYKRLKILKNRIAEYELSVIKFYNQRNAYLSVISRSKKMLRYFPDTQATFKALYYMKHAYENINSLKESNYINAIIVENSTIY